MRLARIRHCKVSRRPASATTLLLPLPLPLALGPGFDVPTVSPAPKSTQYSPSAGRSQPATASVHSTAPGGKHTFVFVRVPGNGSVCRAGNVASQSRTVGQVPLRKRERGRLGCLPGTFYHVHVTDTCRRMSNVRISARVLKVTVSPLVSSGSRCAGKAASGARMSPPARKVHARHARDRSGSSKV